MCVCVCVRVCVCVSLALAQVAIYCSTPLRALFLNPRTGTGSAAHSPLSLPAMPAKDVEISGPAETVSFLPQPDSGESAANLASEIVGDSCESLQLDTLAPGSSCGSEDMLRPTESEECALEPSSQDAGKSGDAAAAATHVLCSALSSTIPNNCFTKNSEKSEVPLAEEEHVRDMGKQEKTSMPNLVDKQIEIHHSVAPAHWQSDDVTPKNKEQPILGLHVVEMRSAGDNDEPNNGEALSAFNEEAKNHEGIQMKFPPQHDESTKGPTANMHWEPTPQSLSSVAKNATHTDKFKAEEKEREGCITGKSAPAHDDIHEVLKGKGHKVQNELEAIQKDPSEEKKDFS